MVYVKFYQINFKLVQEMSATCIEITPTPYDCITHIKMRGTKLTPQNLFSSNVIHANPSQNGCVVRHCSWVAGWAQNRFQNRIMIIWDNKFCKMHFYSLYTNTKHGSFSLYHVCVVLVMHWKMSHKEGDHIVFQIILKE